MFPHPNLWAWDHRRIADPCTGNHIAFKGFYDLYKAYNTLVGVEYRQNAWVNVFLLSGESWQISKHEIYSKNENRSSVCSYLLSELFYRIWFTGWFQSHGREYLMWSISRPEETLPSHETNHACHFEHEVWVRNINTKNLWKIVEI